MKYFRIMVFGFLFSFFSIAPSQAQLPLIRGHVFDDLDLNGSLSSGEAISGATISLYADDGDGVFDIGVDSLVSTESTDADGLYSFSALDIAQQYFVYQGAQTVDGIPLEVTVSDALSVGTFNTMIDDFGSTQRVVGYPIEGIAVNATNLTSAGVIGGQRDLRVDHISGPAESVLLSNPFNLNEVLEFNQSAGVIAVATVTWDGVDGDTSITPAASGLGGIDLTEGGNEAFAFDFGIDAAGAGENVTLRIFTGTDVSEAVIPIPVTSGTAVATQIVPFADFVGDADLTSVDAIQLELGGNNMSIDAQVGPIGLIGAQVHDISVLNPEPSAALMGLFALVWFAGSRRKRSRLA